MGDRALAVVGDFGLGAAPVVSDALDVAGLERFMRAAAPRLTAPVADPWTGASEPVAMTFPTLSSLSPGGVAESVPGLRRLLDFSAAIRAMKGVFGCIPGVVKMYRERLGDEAARLRLRAELGFPEDARWGGAELAQPEGALPEALLEAIARIDQLDAGTERGAFLRGALEYARMTPETEGYAQAVLGARAMVLQLLHPDCLCLKPDRAVIEAMVGDAERRLARATEPVVHAPSFFALERAWRGARWLAERARDDRFGALAVRVVHAPAIASLAGLLPRGGLCGVVLVEPVGLARLDALRPLGQWALEEDATAWFEPDASLTRALADGDSAAVAAWDDLRVATGGALVACVGALLLRLPYGDSTLPNKRFRFEEDLARWAVDPPAGSAAVLAAAGAPSASHDALRWEYVDPEGAVVQGAGPFARRPSPSEEATLRALRVRVAAAVDPPPREALAPLAKGPRLPVERRLPGVLRVLAFGDFEGDPWVPTAQAPRGAASLFEALADVDGVEVLAVPCPLDALRDDLEDAGGRLDASSFARLVRTLAEGAAAVLVAADWTFEATDVAALHGVARVAESACALHFARATTALQDGGAARDSFGATEVSRWLCLAPADGGPPWNTAVAFARAWADDGWFARAPAVYTCAGHRVEVPLEESHRAPVVAIYGQWARALQGRYDALVGAGGATLGAIDRALQAWLDGFVFDPGGAEAWRPFVRATVALREAERRVVASLTLLVRARGLGVGGAAVVRGERVLGAR